MKKLEISQELPKCDTETQTGVGDTVVSTAVFQNEQMLLEK